MQKALSSPRPITVSGRTFSKEEIISIGKVVASCNGLSRNELGLTVCELLEWERDNGKLKSRDCWDLLNQLNDRGDIALPALRAGRPKGKKTTVSHTESGEERDLITGTLSDIAPIRLKLATSKDDLALWRELLDRYHYLGFSTPFGAQLTYLAYAEGLPGVRCGEVVAGLQFTSPAWSMKSRDQWIGWDGKARKRNLQLIVNQGRFLILPWIKVKNLASHLLSLASQQISNDWKEHYGRRPLLLETLVKSGRYKGTCYRAANWTHVGETRGEGRSREHIEGAKQGGKKLETAASGVKQIFLYPLASATRSRTSVELIRKQLACT
ncbi:MAG: DUF4338 domain-containing protein [Candidatus Thioglobus sp.]|mgnify:FL=1|jgi:hypothetical protein|nr:DUF4338 domain-containing protein [Candidatus Thioglobus sp.]